MDPTLKKPVELDCSLWGLKVCFFFFSSVQEIMVIADPKALKLFRKETVNIYSRK